MTKGQRIRARRRELGLTLEALAIACKTSKQTIQRYENGVIENIPDARFEAIARALGTTPAYLMGWEDGAALPHPSLRPVGRRTVPMLGRIACGEPIYAEEDFCGYELAGEGACNFYKCGDLTEIPHYLAWAPLSCDTPDYHRRQDFGCLKFL